MASTFDDMSRNACLFASLMETLFLWNTVITVVLYIIISSVN